MKNPAAFKPGCIPWNKNKKGIHLSPETEFKKGDRVGPKHPCWKGGVQYHKRDGVYLTTSPCKRVRRARAVWSAAHGPISSGFVIVHLDGDRYNDELDNLEMISRAENMKRNSRTAN